MLSAGTPKTQTLLCIVQVIVSRMRTIAHQQEGNRTRIVGLSTSLANAKDLGEWIGATTNGMFNFPPGELRECWPPERRHNSCSQLLYKPD